MKKKYWALAVLPLMCGCSTLWETENENKQQETVNEQYSNEQYSNEQQYTINADDIFRTDKTILSYMPEENGCRFKQIYGYIENEKYRETDSRELFVDAPCVKFDFKNYAVYLTEKRVKRTLERFERKKDDKMFVSFNQKGNNCVIDFSAGVAENGKYRETDVKQVTFGSRECKGIIENFILENSSWLDEKSIKHPVVNEDFLSKKSAGKTDKTLVSLKQVGNSCVYSRSYGWSLNGKFTETDFKQITFGNTQCSHVSHVGILKDRVLEGEMNLKAVKQPFVM